MNHRSKNTMKMSAGAFLIGEQPSSSIQATRSQTEQRARKLDNQKIAMTSMDTPYPFRRLKLRPLSYGL